MASKQKANWSPYDNNGGTCVAIAGSDYCVMAADTRMSTGYSILTRDYSKICKLADKCVLASSGFQADVKALQKNLAARHLVKYSKESKGATAHWYNKFSIYQHQHNKQMSCPAMAQLLSNTLYYKRFFPYYAFNVLGGLDNEGKGCVFTYDAVGSYERVGYSSQGSGSTLIIPVFDNQLKAPSPLLLPAKKDYETFLWHIFKFGILVHDPRSFVGWAKKLLELTNPVVVQDAVTPLSESEAVDLVKDVFASAAERDIYTGDRVEIVIINAEGIRREITELRKD